MNLWSVLFLCWLGYVLGFVTAAILSQSRDD
jgi:hypothetical protein